MKNLILLLQALACVSSVALVFADEPVPSDRGVQRIRGKFGYSFVTDAGRVSNAELDEISAGLAYSRDLGTATELGLVVDRVMIGAGSSIYDVKASAGGFARPTKRTRMYFSATAGVLFVDVRRFEGSTLQFYQRQGNRPSIGMLAGFEFELFPRLYLGTGIGYSKALAFGKFGVLDLSSAVAVEF